MEVATGPKKRTRIRYQNRNGKTVTVTALTTLVEQLELFLSHLCCRLRLHFRFPYGTRIYACGTFIVHSNLFLF